MYNTPEIVDSEGSLQYAAHLSRSNTHAFPNVQHYAWESDILIVMKSGYVYEYEAKISRSDYLADFKKEQKHEMLLKRGYYSSYKTHDRNGNPYLYSHLAESYHPNFRDHSHPDNRRYYEMLYWAIRCYHNVEARGKIPNKFYYICPEGLIKPDEVPEYAGLVYRHGSMFGTTEIKAAPLLHKTKITDKELADLGRKMSFRIMEHIRTKSFKHE